MKINKNFKTSLQFLTNYLSLLLCLILLTYSKTSFATAIPFSGTVSVQTSSKNGAKYLRYTKDGVTSNFYTNYLPPKGSYNLSTSFESVLERCQATSDMAINYIGIDCMIAIPPPCPTSINGVTCLNYSSVFRNISSSKNFDPIECQGGTDGVNCLSTLKPYCHQVDNPVLGLNCKLPPCNAIPNSAFRRPGVNCMADCNQAPGDSIKHPQLFMEGFNCLRSCLTSSGGIVGANCVLEFNDYVMPFCKTPRTPNGQATPNYLKTSKPQPSTREDCIDYQDLPICGAGESNLSKRCTNRCATDSDTNAELTCATPTYINSFCHNNKDTPNCKKYACHQLSANELKQSRNAIMAFERISDQAGCTTSDYTNFSYKQLANDGTFNNFTVNYTLAKKPCNSPDYLDTETIVKILGSSYYQTSATGSYPFLDIIINNSLNFLQGSSNSALRELHTPEHERFAITTIFDRSSLCKYTNISEKIACVDYKISKLAPYDCNSNGFAPTSTASTCNDSSPSQNCYCNIANQEYCYKTGINCNKAANQIYSICKTLNQSAGNLEPDSSVSWFFKPALDPLAIKEVGGVKKIINLTDVSSYMPLKTSLTSAEIVSPSDEILMSLDTLKANYNSVSGIIWASTSPGTNDEDLGQGPISPEYICGMKNDIRGTPSEDAVYYGSDVQSFYGLDDKIIHKFKVCTRLMSTGAITDESCGRRRCRANCSGLGSGFLELCTKNCGVDICNEIQVITDESGAMTENCISDEKSFKEQYPYELSSNCRTSRGGRKYCSVQKKFPKCAVKLSNNGSALENARIRSFIPDPGNNYICSVLEFKGVTTKHFSPSYFNGDEFFIVPTGNYKSITATSSGTSRTVTKTLFKKICISGIYDTSTGNCINGFDTNKDGIEVNVWRTSKIVRNILQPPNSNGNWDMSLTRDGNTDYFYLNDDGMDYVDQFGYPAEAVQSRSPLRPNMSIQRLNFNNKIKYETSDCIKFSLRHPSPIYNNVESRRTAPSLFIPSLLIDDTCFTGGGSAGTPVCDSSPDTDFYTPAVKVIWGNKSASFALQTDPNAETNYKIIKINFDSEKSVDYKVFLRNAGLTDYTGIVKTIFLKKSFDIEKRPNVCLYEKEVVGSETKESLISCVPRRRANAATVSSVTPATPSNQTLYNQTDFNVKFYHPSYSSFTPNVITIPKLTNLENTFELKKCLGNISNQGYPVCIERHECTILNFECIENERDLIAELNKNPRNEALVTTMKKVSKYCNEVLLPKCNNLKGLLFSPTNSKLNTSTVNGFNAPANGNFYGWNNEACIVSGIDVLDDPALKKYLVETIPSDPSYDGKCFGFPTCTLYNFSESQALTLPENQRIREAKPREIGANLCFEYTKFLQGCPPISFVTTPNPDRSDPFYLLNLDTPDQSHINRFQDPNGHGEFNIAFIGNSIEGTCSGFYQKNGALTPIATCTASGWSNFTNECIQYSCPALITSSNGANDLGEYTANYDPPKIFKSLIGKVHGYGTWNAQNIYGTSKVNGSFISCNVGFRKENSSANYLGMTPKDGSSQLISYINSLSSSSSSDDQDKRKVIMSLFGKITASSYTDGITPSRKCNQLGIWEEVTNPCQRITCPALNFESPADAGAYNLNSFGISIDNNTAGVANIRTAESLFSTIQEKISFTLSENITGKATINVIYSSTQTPYTLYLADGTTKITNIEKDKIYAFSYNTTISKYVQLDTSRDGYLKELWSKSGGAIFESGYALRSKNYLYVPNTQDILDKHLVYGTCNTQLGYLSLGASPSMVCDHLGNWTNLNNGCVSDCSEINGIVGNDRGHGFAVWNKSSPRIGQSAISTARACIGTTTFAYPYDPINDNEGTKKDFGIGNKDIGITVDNFDSIIETINGADYTVSASTPLPAPSDDNQQGKEYAFKIKQVYNSLSSSSAVSSEKVISLFNANTLTLNAPTDSIWSKITFASFGTPDYSIEENLRIDSANNCDFLYSKLVLALKCIGKNTCNISLTDFLNYDSYMPPSCQQNLGNGQNGDDATIEEIGGAGGGGGGNSSALAGSILVTNTNGINTYSLTPSQNGNSYCDQNFHLTLCEVSLGANGGRKVDITQNDTGLFDGQSGLATIKVAPADDTAEASKTVYTYTTPGVYTINVPTLSSVIGKTDIYFYVDYDIIGGGGGGGGEAIAQGTDGNSGSRIRGKFRIEAGKSFKVHVGGGGKAGKTGCFTSSPSSSAVVSEIEDKYLPNKILISSKTQNLTKKINSKLLAKKQKKSYQNIFATNNIKKPTKYQNKNNDKIFDIILAKNSNRQIFDEQDYYKNINLASNHKSIKNSIKNIFQKISKEFFISNAYSDTRVCGGVATGNWVREDNCNGYDYGKRQIYCSCPHTGHSPGVYGYEDSYYNGSWGSYGGDNTITQLTGRINKLSSIQRWNDYTRYKFTCSRGFWGLAVWYYSDIARLVNVYCNYNNDTWDTNANDDIDDIHTEYYRDCGSSGHYEASNNCGCNAYRYWNGSSCAWNQCYTPDALGITSQWGYNGYGTTSCNKANSNGTFDWTCGSNGGQASITRNGCGCNSGYRADGTNCSINACTTSATQGYGGGESYSGTATTKKCNGTNFDNTINLSFPTCDTNGAAKSTTSPAGTCTCKSGYTLSGSGNSATCKQNCILKDSSSTYTAVANFGFTISSTDSTSLSGDGGTATIACSGTGYSTSNATLTCQGGTLSLTTACSCAKGYYASGNKCLAATCTLPAQTGFASQTLSTADYPATSTTAVTKTCTGTNFTGTLTFNCPTATAATNTGTLFSGSCTCSAGYYLNTNNTPATCDRIKCTINNTDGYSGSTTIDYNGAGDNIVSCNKTNYNTTNQLTYNNCDSNGKVLTYKSGTCGCATNYFKLSATPPSSSTCISVCNMTPNDLTKWGLPSTTTTGLSSSSTSITCKNTDGYAGNTAVISCAVSGSSTVHSISTNCNCSAGYAHSEDINYAGHSVPSIAWERANSCFKQCSVSVNKSLSYGTGASSYTVLQGTTTKACTGTGYVLGNTIIDCDSAGTPIIADANVCSCSSGYTHSSDDNHTVPTSPSSDSWNKKTSCFKQCSVTTANSQTWGTGSSTYKVLEGTNTKACTGTGYSSGNATIACNSSGTATIANVCSCSAGYAHSSSSNHTVPSYGNWDKASSCFRICNVSPGNAHGWGVGTTSFDILEGTNNINCSGTRYAVPLSPNPPNTLAISCDSSNNASVSSGCACASGYAKSASGGSHTKPANVSTEGSEINYYYSTPSTPGQTDSGTCFRECSVSAEDSNAWGTGTSTYKVLEGTNTKACASNGFVTGDNVNISINCNSAGIATAPSICNKFSCPSPLNLEGVNGSLTSKSGQNIETCNANGYTGQISYYCTSTTSGGTTTYSHVVTSACTEYACSGSVSVPGITAPISGGTGANELPCQSSLGYSGKYKYYCDSLGSHISVQACTANVCNIVPDSETGTHGIGFKSRTGLVASGSFDCDADGWGGTKYYTCTSNDTVETTAVKCTKNACNDFTNSGVVGTITGKTGVSTVACTTPGYSGNLEFYCDDSRTAQITTYCTENTCNVISGIGYSGKSNQKISGSYACSEGYYGTVNWVCETGNPNATVTQNCTRITCNPPASAYASAAILEYTGSKWTSYSCKTGYKAGYDLLTNTFLYPAYKCETDPDGENPSVVSIRNACVEVTCTIPGYGTFGYNGGNRHEVPCDNYQGLMGTAIFACDENGAVSFTQTCFRITCNLPTCESGSCPANVQNTLEDGTRIPFNTYFNDLNCKQSHYFENCPTGVTSNCGRPRARCIFVPGVTTTASAGVAEFSGRPCQQTTCSATNNLNSVIDLTNVNWTGDAYVTTSCKSGYYSINTSSPPQYRCSGSGSSATYSFLNPCNAITCSVPTSTFGMNQAIPLSWGSSVQTACNKTGYSGNFTYNCTGSANPGTFSAITNNCIVRSCNLSSNNATTFASYVVNGQNLGGEGGKILSSSTYFKGGNGGRSSTSTTTGGGGGGGSATFIETSEGRIIAIAGGGGGGNGGGSAPINSPTINLSPIANSKLSSNILGSYFIGKMQTAPIQNSDQAKTGGLIYGLSDASNAFSLSAPPGLFVSDIYFSSLGNPLTSARDAVNPNSIPDSFSVKYNTCHSSNSLRLAQVNCQSRDSCALTDINDLDFEGTCTPAISTKKLAVVAGYTYKEPSLTIGGVTKLVKEINISTMTFNPALLQNNKVYSFLDFGTFWLKNEYWDDEFIAKTSVSVSSSDPLKIKFHRSNITLEPKLKIMLTSGSTSTDISPFYKIKKIVNDEPTPISKGYIKENVFYIVRLNNSSPDESFWEIREYSDVNAVAIPLENRELPKRTCMTTQLSKTGMVGTIWSPANSVCSNKCPGYDPDTKVGDDRIGAGATLHYTSNLPAGGIVYWDETNAGSTKILVMSTSNSAETGLSDKGYRVFQRYSGSTNSKQFEKESPNQRSGGVFILERECGTDGVWRDPKPLCSTGGGDASNSAIGNFNDTRVYLDHSSHPDNTIYNNSTTKKRYIQANEPTSTAIGECLSGYDRQTNDGIGIYDTAQLKPKLTFACKSFNSDGKRFEDLTYLESISGFDCIKYCKFENLTVSSGVEKRGKEKPDKSFTYNNETRLKPTHSVSLDCQSTHTYALQYVRPNYLYNEINRINKTYNIDWDNCNINSGSNGEVRSTVTSTDIPIADIQEKHINCMDELIFARYWARNPNYDLYWATNPNDDLKSYVNVGGEQYERTLEYYYYNNPEIHKNVRYYFDEGAVLIANKKTELRQVLSNPILPVYECVSSSKDDARWSSETVGTGCRIAESCLITKYHGIRHGAISTSLSKIARYSKFNFTLSKIDEEWFPLKSYIYSNDSVSCGEGGVERCLKHGKTISSSDTINSSCDYNKYGRCGYMVIWRSNDLICAGQYNAMWDMKRKFLKSVSCNDGQLSSEWDFSDPNPKTTCTEEGGYHEGGCAHVDYYDEEKKPQEKFLGYSNAIDFNSISDTFSKSNTTTKLDCP